MISQKELAELKGQGILSQKQEGYFSFRVLSRAGNFTSQQLRDLADIAEKYGRGYLGETTRLAAEIPWIKYEDIDAVKLALKDAGLAHGGTGKKVRPLVACKGTVCPHGLYDTQKLCGECHDAYFAKPLHAKAKITFVGCPNNCAKANTNDIGLVGQAMVEFHPDLCINCGKCTKVCRTKSLTIENDQLKPDFSSCVNCGKCAEVCPVEAMTVKEKGLAVYLGGRMGRGYRFGDRLPELYPEDAIPNLIEKILDTYTELGEDGERICHVIDRVGLESFKQALDAHLKD